MRLIRTSDLTLHEFAPSCVPKYAILSHRWEEGEISYQELKKNKNRWKPGWTKVQQFCRFASRRQGIEFVWIDTCCIDRTSSSELSEAINSMYTWYREARYCVAYLSDVEVSPHSAPVDWHGQMQKSLWFARGWTLQELLAPRLLEFVSSDWETVLGTKQELSFLISKATQIPTDEIRRFRPDSVGKDHQRAGACSFAQVMSWAAKRITSRPEDLAYSLMGLLDVNMPLLYGEGSAKAFLRLQLEYLHRVDDETIFSWTMPKDIYYSGLLAPSPQCFKDCGSMRVSTWDPERPPYQMTNKGLRIEPLLLPALYKGASNTEYLMPLNCQSSASRECGIAIRVQIEDEQNRRPGKIAARYSGRDGIELVKFDQAEPYLKLKRYVLFLPQTWA